MVITLFADRRSSEFNNIALRLARALASRGRGSGAGGVDEGAEGVMLVVEGGIGASLGGSIASDPPGPVDVADGPLTLVDLHDGTAPADLVSRLHELSARRRATVVALAGAPRESALAAFDVADRILLVSDPSVASIRATQRTLKLCRSLGYGIDKVGVVLHGFADDAPLAPAEAAMALKREIYWVIPGDSADTSTLDAACAGLADRLTGRT